MRDLKVWIRIGDQDDYHDHDSIDDALAAIHDALDWPDFKDDGPCQSPHEVQRYRGPGLIGLVFPGTPLQHDNSVSFYWGDDDAQLEDEISAHELETIQRLLS